LTQERGRRRPAESSFLHTQEKDAGPKKSGREPIEGGFFVAIQPGAIIHNDIYRGENERGKNRKRGEGVTDIREKQVEPK